MGVTPAEFQYIQTMVRDNSAIVLDDTKVYLVDARLGTLVRSEKLESVAELIRRLRASRWGELHRKVVEAMTTNETSFFRDAGVYRALEQKVIPDIVARRGRQPIRIWCGATSTGQEPYSVLMTLANCIKGLDRRSVQMLCTDIDTQVLARAQEGLYSQLEVNRGLPARMLVKYFDKNGAQWQVKQQLRELIDFRQMNLASAWPAIPRMDLVLIRNVLIYFDTATKKTILRRVRGVMDHEGYFFLGGSETTLGIDDDYQLTRFERAVAYRKKAVPSAALEAAS
ncbi:MAG: protein-glutamate O-methyltransferase CheR [Myxococcales bacterium]|nr:protein-glutamate O-methyltransferase CheR [Myxococcales bacterium]